jgi:hypothetical protein
MWCCASIPNSGGFRKKKHKSFNREICAYRLLVLWSGLLLLVSVALIEALNAKEKRLKMHQVFTLLSSRSSKQREHGDRVRKNKECDWALRKPSRSAARLINYQGRGRADDEGFVLSSFFNLASPVLKIRLLHFVVWFYLWSKDFSGELSAFFKIRRAAYLPPQQSLLRLHGRRAHLSFAATASPSPAHSTPSNGVLVSKRHPIACHVNPRIKEELPLC